MGKFVVPFRPRKRTIRGTKRYYLSTREPSSWGRGERRWKMGRQTRENVHLPKQCVCGNVWAEDRHQKPGEMSFWAALRAMYTFQLH